MSDDGYKIEFFPKWFSWVFKSIPFIIILVLLIALITRKDQTPEVREVEVIKEVIVHKEVECNTIQDITDMMYRNDTRIFSVKRLSNHSFEVMSQDKNGEITRIIHSWE